MILFLFGPDAYRLHQESLLERERFFGTGTQQTTRRFDASDRCTFLWKEVMEAVADTGLFAVKKCVVVDNVFAFSPNEQEKCVLWLKGSAQGLSETLCIFTDPKPDKRTALYKSLSKTAQTRERIMLKGTELVRYVEGMMREKFPRTVFERGVVPLLLEAYGSDLFRIENEIEKLVVHAGGQKKVSGKDVYLLGSAGVFDEIFGALGAIARGDKKAALRSLLHQMQKGEHPIYLLTMCAYQMRTMLSVGECLEKGISQPALIAREVKIHPFVAQKTVAAMQLFGIARAKKAFGLLGRYDVAIKTGKMDAGLAVEEFVLRS